MQNSQDVTGERAQSPSCTYARTDPFPLLTSPTEHHGAPFTIATAPGAFVLTLSRDPARTDVTITIEACDNLATGPWTAIARSTSGRVFTSLAPEAAIGETGTSPVAVTITVTNAPHTQRCFRVKVGTPTP